jgi:hypothetical protein
MSNMSCIICQSLSQIFRESSFVLLQILNIITTLSHYMDSDCIKFRKQINDTQNYWVFFTFPSPGILENMTFRKLDLFPSSGEGGGEDTYSVGPLRKS